MVWHLRVGGSNLPALRNENSGEGSGVSEHPDGCPWGFPQHGGFWLCAVPPGRGARPHRAGLQLGSGSENGAYRKPPAKPKGWQWFSW